MYSSRIPVKVKKFSANSDTAALLIHGGCFTEGDETWNCDQAQYISNKCNVDVFTIDFSKKSFLHSKKDIIDFYTALRGEYKGRVGLIGCSSGGFLVLSLLNEIDDPLFVTLLCPVMDPEKREDMLLAMRSKQRTKIHDQQVRYFKKRPYPTARVSNFEFGIVAARDDENVPLILIEEESKRFQNATIHIVEGTHAISYKPNDAVAEIIMESINKCQATLQEKSTI
ncbi:MAG: hypothetical protein A3F11_01220 [Gammaproteobacteria bacterium RIFCSPHIGHO2_12_FULL_37_14]|nr:MAG: hypothetical protein A3F11_01220 [Gammaproteobacteria bacterium RIFCSPHIGHO2_12_FULL_37_14]